MNGAGGGGGVARRRIGAHASRRPAHTPRVKTPSTGWTGVRALACIALAVSCRSADGKNPPESTPEAASVIRASLVVEVSGVEDDGAVLAYLFSNKGDFPGDFDKASRAATRASAGSATLRFDDVLPGTYAVIAAHDENGNGELDTNFLGIPQEGVGTSGKARKGPPRWKDAKFDVPGTTTISIVVNYF